jgi:hypothetical protein
VAEAFSWIRRERVLVGYDYTMGASVPLTENPRRRLAA